MEPESYCSAKSVAIHLGVPEYGRPGALPKIVLFDLEQSDGKHVAGFP